MALFDPDKFMQRLREGLTPSMVLRGVNLPGKPKIERMGSRSAFRAQCEKAPEWGAEAARLTEVNAAAARLRSDGAKRYGQACRKGHPFTGNNIGIHYTGRRYCVACNKLARARGADMTPAKLAAVRSAVRSGKLLSDIIQGSQAICTHATLRRYRVEHPEFDRFIIESARSAWSRAQLMQCRLVPSNAQFVCAAPVIIKPVRKEIPPFFYQDGDLEWISSLIPRGFPQRDDVIQNLFMDLCARAIGRDEVPARIKALKAEQERLFPTKYRKFGDSVLVSLDEVLFEDGATTRGDTVSRGLWD